MILETPDPLRSNPVLRDLSVLNEWKGVAAILFEWSAILLAVFFSEKFWNPLIYFFVTIWIGSRLHALGVLMHEATHYRFLKNKKWNDIIAEVFCAWPLTYTLQGYRNSHLAHHAYLETEKDPDWVFASKEKRYHFPKSGKEIALIFLQYLVGYYAVKEILLSQAASANTPFPLKICRYFYYGLIVGTALYFGVFWKLAMYWVVPLMTWTLFFAYLRDVAEHYGGLDYDHFYTQTRTTVLSWWESLLLVPYNANYHIEHHLYTSVPFYNLKKLHKILLKDPVYAAKAHVTRGYARELLRECMVGLKTRQTPPL